MPTDFSTMHAVEAQCSKCSRVFTVPITPAEGVGPFHDFQCEKCKAHLSTSKNKAVGSDLFAPLGAELGRAVDECRPSDSTCSCQDQGAPGSYAALGAEIGRLVEEKQKAYGDSFGKAGDILRILYPAGVPPEKFDDMLALARMIDKQFRIATGRDALGESPWRDIAGYALLAVKQAEGEGENG